jgi:hypothetical protein
MGETQVVVAPRHYENVRVEETRKAELESWQKKARDLEYALDSIFDAARAGREVELRPMSGECITMIVKPEPARAAKNQEG